MAFPYLSLETGTTDKNAYYNSGNGSKTLTFVYAIEEGDVASDLNYKSVNSLSLNNSKISDSLGGTGSLTLPPIASEDSLGGSKNIVVDGVKPVISITLASVGDRNVSAVDDDSGITTMGYVIQESSSCPETPPEKRDWL